MILFRHADPRFPFLWEGAGQPPGRWHAGGEGPVHYLADTPVGAWAEFLRHEEITDAEDVATIRRAIYAVEVDDVPATTPRLPRRTLQGGLDTYPACQAEAARARGRGARGLRAPSAALLPGGATGQRVDSGIRTGPARDGEVVVLFGPRPDAVGWPAAVEARPPAWLLDRVRHLA